MLLLSFPFLGLNHCTKIITWMQCSSKSFWRCYLIKGRLRRGLFSKIIIFRDSIRSRRLVKIAKGFKRGIISICVRRNDKDQLALLFTNASCYITCGEDGLYLLPNPQKSRTACAHNGSVKRNPHILSETWDTTYLPSFPLGNITSKVLCLFCPF